MKVSVCVTTFNEEKSVVGLLESLLGQSHKPDEIVIVDGNSTDKTIEIIRHYQKKDRRIKLLIEKCSRARGRNLSVELAKNEIITMTDAGCVAKRHWLENITEPFMIHLGGVKASQAQPATIRGVQRIHPRGVRSHTPRVVDAVGVVAGFYEMVGESPLQKAEAVFLGITPNKFNDDFLPSTRSIAFRKSIWDQVGGFPEELADTAEDTIFNYRLIKQGVKITRVKNALVEWGMPENLREFFDKVFGYAKGDAKSGIWFFPEKGLSSHNIKVIFVFLRYIIGLVGLIGLISLIRINITSLLWTFLLAFFTYVTWAYRKVYMETKNFRSGLLGIILQFASDLAVMAGFISGIV